MKTRFVIFVTVLLASVAVTAQTKSSYSTQLDAVVKTLNDKNTAALQPLLAANYTIGGVPAGKEADIYEQLFAQLPAVTGYTVNSETKEAGGTRISTELLLSYAGQTIGYPASFLINAENKIQELNILDGAQVEQQEATATPQ
jgi:hypothetical protein